jgi:hypothetical protein
MKMIIKNFTANKRKFLVLAMTFLLLNFTSCLNVDEGAEQVPVAWLSIYHGAVSIPDLDIFNESRQINFANPLRFSETFPYNRFYPGNRNLRFNTHNSLNLLLEQSFALEADKVYSLFLFNGATALEAVMAEDNWEEPNAEEAKLRFVNLAGDTGEVNLFVDDQPFQTAAFKDIDSFAGLPRGRHNFTVRSANDEILLEVTNVDIRGNRVYTLILRGLKDTPEENKKLSLQLTTNFIRN